MEGGASRRWRFVITAGGGGGAVKAMAASGVGGVDCGRAAAKTGDGVHGGAWAGQMVFRFAVKNHFCICGLRARIPVCRKIIAVRSFYGI